MLSTTQLRQVWSPACNLRPSFKFEFWSGVPITVDGRIVPALRELNNCLRRHNYKPVSGQTWGYNCRRITGGTGYSLHAYGIAIDINSLANPYGPTLITDMPTNMIIEIERIKTKNGIRVWGWGGRYSRSKDAMHFEIVCTPGDLAVGIQSSAVEGTEPVNTNYQEDFNMHGKLEPGEDTFEALDGVALNNNRQAWMRLTARDKACRAYLGGFEGAPNHVTIPAWGDWAVKIPKTANGFFLASGNENTTTLAWVVTPSTV